MFVVMRLSRCCRFVQSRDLVEYSQKLNQFRLVRVLEKLIAICYFQIWRLKGDEKETTLLMDKQVNGGLVTSGSDGTFADCYGAKQRRSKDSTNKIVVMISAVNTETETEVHQRSLPRWSKHCRRWRSKVMTTILRQDKNSAAKNEAAIKIQRAWRNHVNFEFDGEWGDIFS